MPGLAGSDGSPLVAWPFVVKFLVPPRRPPAVCRPRCHHPLPRPPLETTLACLGHRVLPSRSPPRSIISSEIRRSSSLSLSLSPSLVVSSTCFHLLVS